MTPFTPDEMLAVARMVYPLNSGREWRIYEGRICNFDKEHLSTYAEEFNPKLTGTDREQAQACQCIVAAFNLGVLATAIRENYIQGDGNERYFFQVENLKGNIVASVKGPDLLSASIAAILSHVGENR